MLRRLLLSYCIVDLLSLSGHACGEDSVAPDLKLLERWIRTEFKDAGEGLHFEYPDSEPNTLVVNYRTRKFLVHGQSKIGRFSDVAYETTGPSFQGFQLKLSLQESGAVNTAATPQTLSRPYWKTFLDVRPLKGTDKQVFCRLSYGSQVDQNQFALAKKIILNLDKDPR